MNIIRRPAVAGKFYPQDPHQLESDVRRMLDSAQVVDCQPKILIAPHAGYAYSGPVAATAFASLGSQRHTIGRVVILGTCHTRGDPLIFATHARCFDTPLGAVNTDLASIESAVREGLAVVDDGAHRFDHAVEVQLPFLQVTLDSFELAPFLVGGAPAERVANLIRLLWAGPETIFVISSDLSHYLPYDQASETDRQTAEMIVALDGQSLDRKRACGFRAISGALQVAREKSLSCLSLDLKNSGDAGGPRQRVVGYGAFAICYGTPEYTRH